jgi:hypothetical protein
MKRVQKGQKIDPLSPSLEPVKHLSFSFQRKLMKRADKQRKHFRSSGASYPLVSMQDPYLDTGQSQMHGYMFLYILSQLD